MLRRKDETIHGAQHLHTVVMARAAQEFPETRASAHPRRRIVLRRHEKKKKRRRRKRKQCLVHHHHHHHHHHPLANQDAPIKRAEGGRWEMHELSSSFFLSSLQVLSFFFFFFFKKKMLLLMVVRGSRGGPRWIGGFCFGPNPAQSLQTYSSGRGSDFP